MSDHYDDRAAAVVLRPLRMGERCEVCGEPARSRIWIDPPRFGRERVVLNHPIQASVCLAHAIQRDEPNIERERRRRAKGWKQTTVDDFLRGDFLPE